MDIKQLTYFIEIAESKTITEAAKKLHIAQPALSQSLKALEESVGVPLINRNKRHHTLTHTGEVLYQEAKKIVTQLEATKKKVSASTSQQAEIINVGINTISSHLLLPVIKQMKKDYPQVNLNIHQNESNHLSRMVRKNELDFAIVRFPINTTHLETILLNEEPFYFVCSKSNKNRTHIETLPRRMMTPLILPSNQMLGTYQTILEHLTDYTNLSQNISGCSDMDLLLTMVEADMGCSIVPQSALNQKNYDVDVLSIKDSAISSTYGLVYSKDKELTLVTAHFIDLLTNQMKKKKIA